MTGRTFIMDKEAPALRRRVPTRRLPYVWPFLLSVESGTGEIVKNLAPWVGKNKQRATKRVKESTKVARVLIKTLP